MGIPCAVALHSDILLAAILQIVAPGFNCSACRSPLRRSRLCTVRAMQIQFNNFGLSLTEYARSSDPNRNQEKKNDLRTYKELIPEPLSVGVEVNLF